MSDGCGLGLSIGGAGMPEGEKIGVGRPDAEAGELFTGLAPREIAGKEL